eukprot:SAG31_NODE_22_length_33849_cov_13.713096_4_plen_166_part_00
MEDLDLYGRRRQGLQRDRRWRASATAAGRHGAARSPSGRPTSSSLGIPSSSAVACRRPFARLWLGMRSAGYRQGAQRVVCRVCTEAIAPQCADGASLLPPARGGGARLAAPCDLPAFATPEQPLTSTPGWGSSRYLNVPNLPLPVSATARQASAAPAQGLQPATV